MAGAGRTASRCTVAVLAATLLATPASGGAHPPAQPDAASAISLTVSGGVSLGAYEAGFLAYAITALRHDRTTGLRLLTGASAGSLNSLVALLAACDDAAPAVPSDSLFWRTWIPVGFDQLTAAPPGPVGVFSRQWLERGAAAVEEAWNRGFDRSCDVVLGVSTTRLEPRVLRAAGGRLELPRMEEKFAIRIQGRGPGRPPRATNYVSPGGAVPNPLLLTDEHGEIAFSDIRDLVFASMAFPVAFAPQTLRTCIAGETAAPGVCVAAEASPARYVDGGIFDNAPLRMAVGLARSGLHEAGAGSGGLEWRPVPDPGVSALPAGIAFAFVDAHATEYPSSRPEGGADEVSLPRELLRMSSALVETARSKELAVLLEEHPDVADRIVLPRRHFPAASAPLFAFLGFFETDFRVFDFHLGMYDASKLISRGIRTPGGTVLANAPRVEVSWAEGIGRDRFACMRAVYEGEPGAEAACRGEALASFRALLQVSLDQLYDACSATGGRARRVSWEHTLCDRAAAGEPPPRVPGTAPPQRDGWRRRPEESELAYSIRLLAAHGFQFTDLGVGPGRGDLALARIRRAIGRAADRLAAAQPARDRAPVAFAAKVAANSLAYSAPDWTLHVTMGPTESEIGLSRALTGASWLPSGARLAAAVGFRGLDRALSSGSAAPFATLLVGGIEVQPPGSTTLAQFRLGARAGWLLASDDRAGTGSCAAHGDRSVSSCTRPVVQALVGFTVLERFRAQLVGECFLPVAGRSTAWSLSPGIGLELGF